MIFSANKPGSKKSALHWLLLAGLLWAQFAYGSHQLAHDSDELGDPCQVCAGFDSFETALSADCVADRGITSTPVLLPTLSDIAVSNRLRSYSARASP